MRISVAIISHNYGRFLPACIDSVLSQTHQPCEVVVVDDSSTDDTGEIARAFAPMGVRYIRHDAGHVHESRRIGFEETTGDLLLWLDADDLIPHEYLASAVRLFADPHVGIVYSDMLTFGDESEIKSFPPPERVDLTRRNSCHAGSVVRRAAIENSAVFDARPVRQTHCDWLTWRRIAQAGWTLAKQECRYLYRKHGAGMMRTSQRLSWSELLMAESEPLTLWIPLSGRSELWEQTTTWLDWQTWPRDAVQLVLCDTSQDRAFGMRVRKYAQTSNWPDVRYFRMSVADAGVADEDRRNSDNKRAVQRAVSRIYRRMAQEVRTDFVCVIEDDIVPPENGLDLLWQAMGKDIASVSGIYRSRYHGNVVAYDEHRQPIEYDGQDIVDVSYNGFGFCLLRTQLLRDIGIHGGLPTCDYDQNFYAELAKRRDWFCRANWECTCQHLEVTTDTTSLEELANVG